MRKTHLWSSILGGICLGAAMIPAAASPTDGDNDGVADGFDRCPYTQAGARIDAQGCAMDSDGDLIADGLDRCAGTPPGSSVDANGCPRTQAAAVTPPAQPQPPLQPEPQPQLPVQAPQAPAAAVAEVPPPAVPVAPEQPQPPLQPQAAPAPAAPPAPAAVTPTAAMPAPQQPQPPLETPAAAAPVAVPAAAPAAPPPPAAFFTVPGELPPPAAAPAAPEAAPVQVLADETFSDPLYTTLYFGPDSAVLTEVTLRKLGYTLPDLLKNVDRYPRMAIELAGHADPRSDKVAAAGLSLARAEAVKAQLVARGVPAERIRTSGRGKEQPRARGPGDTGRNRRVEILTYPQ